MGIPTPRPVPHLLVRDAAPVIAFYTDVFEAVPIARECLLDGRVLHAELAVGGHRLTVSEWCEGPRTADAGDGPVVLTIAPDDPRLLLERALAAGAQLEAAADGTADAVLRDPAGQRWSVTGSGRPE
ncbi:VOC family protein [Micromonospora coxensis]|uniref:VOC family protein n=1 Tax=Micromonospora coxensis TaxID=356852 RepID=UPI003422B981